MDQEIWDGEMTGRYRQIPRIIPRKNGGGYVLQVHFRKAFTQNPLCGIYGGYGPLLTDNWEDVTCGHCRSVARKFVADMITAAAKK